MNAIENYWAAVVRRRKQELDEARVILGAHQEKVDLLRERLAQAETSYKHVVSVPAVNGLTKSREK
jgi:nitrate reductase assembly molybdenum cofactor insertion protein NarJ